MKTEKILNEVVDSIIIWCEERFSRVIIQFRCLGEKTYKIKYDFKTINIVKGSLNVSGYLLISVIKRKDKYKHNIRLIFEDKDIITIEGKFENE